MINDGYQYLHSMTQKLQSLHQNLKDREKDYYQQDPLRIKLNNMNKNFKKYIAQ